MTTGTATERPVTLGRDGISLRGVLHTGADVPGPRTGIILLHGWSGCRLGPHRMFVTLARRLQASGYVCLRFDFAGRGESDGNARDTTVAGMTQDTLAAVRWLNREQRIEQIVLLGICSGAKVAVAAAEAARDVRHLVLWSGEVMGGLRTRSTRARRSLAAIRAYGGKALHPGTWARLFKGQVNVGLVGRAVAQPETPADAERRAESAILARFRDYAGDILFIYGGLDPATRAAGGGYSEFCRRHGIRASFHEIAEANHSFYGLDWEEQVIQLTANWLAKHRPGPAADGSGS